MSDPSATGTAGSAVPRPTGPTGGAANAGEAGGGNGDPEGPASGSGARENAGSRSSHRTGPTGGRPSGSDGAGSTILHVQRNTRRVLWRALAAAVGSALLVSALAVVGVGALLGLAVVVVLPAFVGLLLRIGVVGVALRATRSPLRKLLLRWVPRSMFIVSLWGFAQAPVPLWNAVALPVTTAMLVLAVGHYCRWQLEREAKGIPVHRRERWLLITVVALALALAGLLVLTAVFIGWSIHHALGALFPD